ncbi:MAG: hypothetical protein ACREFI_00530 [Stellaceae bacterium]
MGSLALLSACAAGPGPYYADYGPDYGYGYDYGSAPSYYGSSFGFGIEGRERQRRDFRADERTEQHAFTGERHAFVTSGRTGSIGQRAPITVQPREHRERE